jgi:predicted MFS family arabinose efflux permease
VEHPPLPARALVAIYASTTASMAAYSLELIALPFRFQQLGISVVEYGVVLAVYALGMLATESVWGVLAFRIGNPRTIAGLGAVVTVLLALAGVVNSFGSFALTLGLVGMFLIFPIPLLRWLALTAGGPGTAGTGSGRYGLFFGLGLVVGAPLGPLLFVEVGFLTLALVAAFIYAVSVAVLLSFPWTTVRLPPRESRPLGEVRDLFTRHFSLSAFTVVQFFVVYSLVINYLQYYSVDLFHGTASQAGYVIGAARGTSLIAGVLLGGVSDRWGPGRTAPFGFLLMVAGTLATAVSTSYAEMVGSTVVFAVGAGWLSASLLPVALGPIRRSAQGTAVGVFGSFEDLGLLVGPILIGAVYSSFGAESIFPVVAAVGLSGCTSAFVLRRLGAPPSSSQLR